jgi:hypothetical protein
VAIQAVPFVLAGMFALIAGYAALQATGVIPGTSQSQNPSTGQTFSPGSRTGPKRPENWNDLIHADRRAKADPTRNLPSGLDTQSGPYSWPTSSQKSAPELQTVAGTTSEPAAPTPTQAAEPPLPEPGPSPEYTGVKAAPIDTVVFVDEPFDPNYYEDVLFQDFGGQELLTVARNDTVNGQNISYQPFKDLGIIRDQYTPNSLLSIQETSDRFFANFLIRLNEKIPGVGNGPSGSNVYLEEGETGSAIIEFINIEANEQVEIQILNAGIIEDIGI